MRFRTSRLFIIKVKLPVPGLGLITSALLFSVPVFPSRFQTPDSQYQSYLHTTGTRLITPYPAHVLYIRYGSLRFRLLRKNSCNCDVPSDAQQKQPNSIQPHPLSHGHFTVKTSFLIGMDRYVFFPTGDMDHESNSNVHRPSHHLRRQALQKIALLSASNDSTVQAEQSDFAKLCHACPRSRSGLNGSVSGPRYTPSDNAKSPMVYSLQVPQERPLLH